MNKKRWLVIIVIVAAAVILAILFDALLANHRPAITSLEAEPEKVTPSGSCLIVCTALDRDGDELSYNWSASGGNISGTGASVNWTAPHSVGSYNVTVTVTDGCGGEATGYVTIPVKFNLWPTIISLRADADWTTPSGSLQMTCTASDLDGDELSYEWSTTGGDISDTGPEVTWTAPEAVGIYHVTVVVKDSHGSSATRTLYISVATGQPPIIEALLVTAEHCYLREEGSGYMVGKGQPYDIGCIAANTSGELVYDWSCDGGEIFEISEDGSMISWTAPDMSCYVTVTVVVSDIADSMASKNITLNVVHCSGCTFGC